MASSERWHTARRWAGLACCLVCSVTAVSAQEGRWERVTAAGVQAFEQGDYASAVRQFQAALPLADAGSLAPSLMNVAASITPRDSTLTQNGSTSGRWCSKSRYWGRTTRS
jgi:hypothetical protein